MFRTRSDTEVLVAAYEAFGDACVERFEGQFAFAIWDARRRRLLLARDRFGVRPLHVVRAGLRLAFASEAKALFQLDDVPRAIDPDGLDQVFTFWGPLAPRTALAGVSEIPPGHLAVVEPGGELKQRGWFEPRFPDVAAQRASSASLCESEAALLGSLEHATALRLLSADVPVGCYLSGGLDSALIASLVRRIRPGELRTFSIRFEDPALDESRFQRLMAEELEARHIELTVTRGDVPRCFDEAVYHVERPVLRAGPAPMFLLARAVREAGIKVVLSGEGADEVLGGYDLFREAKVRAFIARQPGSPSRPLLLDRLYPWMERAPREAREVARRFFTRDSRSHGAALLPPATLPGGGGAEAAVLAGAAGRARRPRCHGRARSGAPGELRAVRPARARPVPRDAHAPRVLPPVRTGRSRQLGSRGRGPLPLPRR